jgi:hypothetical protein
MTARTALTIALIGLAGCGGCEDKGTKPQAKPGALKLDLARGGLAQYAGGANLFRDARPLPFPDAGLPPPPP